MQDVHVEHSHQLTAKRAGGYTLEREGGANGAYSGVLVLGDSAGAVASSVRFLPDPTGGGLLSRDSVGSHMENASAHTFAHPSSVSGGDNIYLGSLSFDAQTGVVRAILNGFRDELPRWALPYTRRGLRTPYVGSRASC